MSKIIYTKEKLEWAAKQSICYSQMFRLLDARLGGNTYQRIKKLINDYDVDVSHFVNGSKAGYIVSGLFKNKKHYSEWLVDGYKSRLQSNIIRRALIESGVEYKCVLCDLQPFWNGKELTLQVDHINGDWRDCRKENLRFLCPNCHTQCPTFCNTGKGKRCKNCNKKINSKSKHCVNCYYSSDSKRSLQIKQRKVQNRPSLEILLSEVEDLGYVGTGKKYGVSDNAIRKWIILSNMFISHSLTLMLQWL